LLKIWERSAESQRQTVRVPQLSVVGQAILERAKTLDELREAVLSVFVEITGTGGAIPVPYLKNQVDESSSHVLQMAIESLIEEGLVIQLDGMADGALKLTAKGALRLWFWDWNNPTRNDQRQPIEVKASIRHQAKPRRSLA